jgi:hypothetical protein
MKAEKLQKHMDRGTIVHGQDTYDHTIGRIVEIESCGATVEGFDPDVNKADRTYYSNDNIRKATDDEIAAYEAFKPAAPEVGIAPRDIVRVVPAACGVEPYKVGDRVQLRAARNGERRIGPTFFVPGTVVTIESLYEDQRDQMYSARGITTHGGPHSQTGLAHADILGLAPAETVEEKPAPTAGRVYGERTCLADRESIVGRRVRCLDNDLSSLGHPIGTLVRVDGSACAYLVRLDNGSRQWAHKVALIGDAPAPTPKRLTVGDKVVAVRHSGNHLAYIGAIARDDKDTLPYLLDANKEGMFQEECTFPLTVDGFRGAAAVQKAAGVVFEEGDFVALVNREGELRVGTIYGGELLRRRGGGGVGLITTIKGTEDWSDRVVVLCKAPKV